MNGEINLYELKEVLKISEEAKAKDRVYTHPLLMYINHIEALVKLGARHREVADFYNRKLQLEDGRKFTNRRLLSARYYWKKKHLIDYDVVSILMEDIKNASKNNNNNAWENI